MKRERQSGFTMIEIGIVVAIIGLLAALAIPAIRKARTRSQCTRVANDLRVFGDAFNQYCMDRGLYPPDCHLPDPWHLPNAEMEEYIEEGSWASRTELGGNFNWEGPSWGEDPTSPYDYAGIALFETTASEGQLRILDEIMDDGNLLTGMLKQTANGRYTYILEER